MLRFILGKSGSGKSTETLKIAGELADSNLPVMLIVPDQSTFECEKTLLDVFGAKKAEKVLVFGFSRLCKYVFELTGNSVCFHQRATKALLMLCCRLFPI